MQSSGRAMLSRGPPVRFARLMCNSLPMEWDGSKFMYLGNTLFCCINLNIVGYRGTHADFLWSFLLMFIGARAIQPTKLATSRVFRCIELGLDSLGSNGAPRLIWKLGSRVRLCFE